MTAHVNSPSSPTGITRDGKETSRLLVAEGGQFRAVAPQPRSESAGGADTSPEGDPSRRREQSLESGDADRRAASGRELELAAAVRGRNFPRLPDEGQTTEFTPAINDVIRQRRTAVFGHIARLQDSTLAHKALQSHVNLSLGRLPHPSWSRRPGRPRGRWIDQIRNDTSQTPADLWRQALGRGHYGRATRRPTLAMR